MIIVTNNEKVIEQFDGDYMVQWVKGTHIDVLIKVRDMIHKGHMLLSHPLSGSVKPNESPYKSIIISKNEEGLDYLSLQLIENSIQMHNNLMIKTIKTDDKKILDDFKEIDLKLLESALMSVSKIVLTSL